MSDQVRCRMCGLEIDEISDNGSQRTPCPNCGSTVRLYDVKLTDTVKILTSMKALGVRAGMSRAKGWFMRTLTAHVPQLSRGGAIAKVERTFDRDGDRYVETVTLQETGEVIHNVDEPLSEHKGHGSDKNR